MNEHSGLVFGIRNDSRLDGPGVRACVLFKGCPMSCWWCPTPEAQSMAAEVRLWKSRCVRCGTCVTLCFMDAAQQEVVPPAVVKAPPMVESPAAVEAQSEIITTAPGYIIDRDACIVCGACVEKCQGSARELVGRHMSVSEVMAQLEADLPALLQAGGVTFSGGEPLMQGDFLGDLLAACKARGLHTAVDTTGYVPWRVIERVRQDVDLFLFELKLMDDTLHRQFTGVSNGVILDNLAALAEAGQPIRLRVPIIPGITDSQQNLQAIAELAATLATLDIVELIPYEETAKDQYAPLGKTFPLEDRCSAAKEQLADAVRVFESAGLVASIICS